MSWLSRRGTDEMHTLARRRLDALARPSAPPEAPLTDSEETELEDPDPAAPPPRRPLDLVAARLPTTVRDGRVAVSRTAAAGLAFLALLALVLAGSYAWRGRAVQAVRPTDPTSTASPQPSASPSGTPGVTPPPSPVGEVVVDVAGKVRHPGVVRLPLGSRVVDAIAAAGGVRGDVDLTGLNLARVLADGEQVVVGAEGAPGAEHALGSGSGRRHRRRDREPQHRHPRAARHPAGRRTRLGTTHPRLAYGSRPVLHHRRAARGVRHRRLAVRRPGTAGPGVTARRATGASTRSGAARPAAGAGGRSAAWGAALASAPIAVVSPLGALLGGGVAVVGATALLASRGRQRVVVGAALACAAAVVIGVALRALVTHTGAVSTLRDGPGHRLGRAGGHR